MEHFRPSHRIASYQTEGGKKKSWGSNPIQSIDRLVQNRKDRRRGQVLLFIFPPFYRNCLSTFYPYFCPALYFRRISHNFLDVKRGGVPDHPSSSQITMNPMNQRIKCRSDGCLNEVFFKTVEVPAGGGGGAGPSNAYMDPIERRASGIRSPVVGRGSPGPYGHGHRYSTGGGSTIVSQYCKQRETSIAARNWNHP